MKYLNLTNHMKASLKLISHTLLFLFLGITTSYSQSKTYDDHLKNTKRVEGFFTFHENQDEGRIILEVDKIGQEFLYYTTIAQGVGANDVGLDRGRLGNSGKVVEFNKSGNKLFLVHKNLNFRATSENTLEKRAVKESFASSILFGFDILATKGDKILIDLTSFLVRDENASKSVKRAGQGDFTFDKSRSAIYFEKTKSFPKNTEFESIITIVGNNPGRSLFRVVPSPEYITLHQHFSFVELPDDGYQVRKFDPRIGFNGVEYEDYSAPIDESMTTKLINRHRLIKKHPELALSEPVKPIVYYIDNGAPELIKNALMEGAKWWNEAFEVAGFKDAFQVRILPADADPSDIRYNVVEWVHRSTRGWSYGSSIIDPRTGEILKGEVTLDSRRVRQDYLIAQGLIGDFDSSDDNSKLTKMALNRIKQLSAHELGHTLGISHNFIASTHNRASVMDYPAPKVDIVSGKLELADAYATGIGKFDEITVNWGYREFAKEVNEKVELDKIVDNAVADGFEFLSDQDARPFGSVHPKNHLWDNGSNVHDQFKHVLEVRKIALSTFGVKRISTGTPYSNLEEVLVPVYMYHRFMTEAVAKSLGGAYYRYGVKGDELPVYTLVPASEQNLALDELLQTLDAKFLALPKDLLKLIPPRAYRYNPDPVETFKKHTGLSFDPLGPAEASAHLTFNLLLDPARVSRLANQNVLQSDLPSLREVLQKTTQTLWKDNQLKDDSYEGQIRRITASMYLAKLMGLAQEDDLATEAKLAVLEAIQTITSLNQGKDGLSLLVQQMVRQFEKNPADFKTEKYLTPPDGQPIDQSYDWLNVGGQ